MLFCTARSRARRRDPVGALELESHVCTEDVMRFHRILAIAGTAVALASVSACGSLPSAGSPAGTAGASVRVDAQLREHRHRLAPRGAAAWRPWALTGINGGGRAARTRRADDGDVDCPHRSRTSEAVQTAVQGDERRTGRPHDGDDVAVDPGSDDQRRQLLKAGLLPQTAPRTSRHVGPHGREGARGGLRHDRLLGGSRLTSPSRSRARHVRVVPLCMVAAGHVPVRDRRHG